MAKRDPEKTARNKVIAEMTAELRARLPRVLLLTGLSNELELNGRYGGKHAEFIDVKNAVIHTPEHFVALWQRGYLAYLSRYRKFGSSSAYYKNFQVLVQNPEVWEFVELFLKRSFMRNFAAYTKQRPSVEEAELWIGHNNASYGLLVTPRFRGGNWENDKSEIRHFAKDYWTIGHVLQTGLVVPFTATGHFEFKSVEEYLNFFENVIVRNSGSPHERAIASRYSDFVRSASDPEKVPLLIPEFRYAGLVPKHLHRLDFCVIDPFTMDRVGFELSPWSTHGEMAGLKGKTQKEINEIAKDNFEAHMRKLKAFFKRHGIYTLVFTDEDFADYDALFATIKGYLTPAKAATQLQLRTHEEFLKYTL